jgi:hypothetical protein
MSWAALMLEPANLIPGFFGFVLTLGSVSCIQALEHLMGN